MGLSLQDRAMLAGECGLAAQMAMRILERMRPIVGAQSFLDISAAHIDSALFQGDATLAYAERLAALGAQVVVPTTLNVSGVDEHGWRAWAVPPDWADKARRQMAAYQSMGCKPTWTCAPYQESQRPGLGDQVAWGESSAVVFANSVLGARTERYPDLMDICAAITGRVPAAGLHLDANRAGQVLLTLRGIPPALQASESFYGVLGHFVGKAVARRIPVIQGLEVCPTEDQLKALGAAAASSGAVALFHIVGVTPEARTESAALQGRKPLAEITVTLDKLRAARKELSTITGAALDLVVLGSPHFSLTEFQALVPLVEGHRRHPDVQFLITASRVVKAMAARAGYLAAIKQFGGTITVDTCILTTPMLPSSVKMLMTNSAKYAYYAPGLLGAQIVYGDLKDCVRSAICGHIVRDNTLWKS